jgi:hypothetical protein
MLCRSMIRSMQSRARSSAKRFWTVIPITSSAATSGDGGTVRPSAFAVAAFEMGCLRCSENRPTLPPGQGVTRARDHRAIYCRVKHQCATGPLAFFQASMPPWMWQAEERPASCAACTAMDERSPKAQ